uniref:Thioredoxin domain-containing protein n=1 Tax=Mesocestoides corti TaxID=53468 RepID=A0A5K3FDL2_MESCO
MKQCQYVLPGLYKSANILPYWKALVMPPKRSSRRSSFSLQNHIQYAFSKEECLSLLRSHTKQLVVFIFYAEWCPHSKELKPFLEALVKDDQNVIIVLINVDDAEDVIPFYSLYAVPSFYFFKNQAEIGTHVGGDITKLRGFIRKYKRIKETE